jgi:C1A family cysteine protease
MRKFGWIKEEHSAKDYTLATPVVASIYKQITTFKPTVVTPLKADLRTMGIPVRDQGALGSCTAFMLEGLIQYMQKKSSGTYSNMSPLFMYKVTRKLMGWTGDTGAYIRNAIGSAVLLGSPTDRYYPYNITKFDQEPSAFHYAIAQNFKALIYFRLDTPGITRSALLTSIKKQVNAKIPVGFGFNVYESYEQSDSNGGAFPYPTTGEKQIGGHAVCIYGFDDSKVITNSRGNRSTTGAFLIRNSWGTGWGDKGYGWLPYEYVLKNQADDFWVITSEAFVNTKLFV